MKDESRLYSNLRVAKWFGDTLFFGKVVSSEVTHSGRKIWRIVFDDEDQEDLYWDELKTAASLGTYFDHAWEKVGGPYIGKRVAKYFGGDLHVGEVTSEVPPIGEDNTPLWNIKYSDNSSEDFDSVEMQTGLALHASEMAWQNATRVSCGIVPELLIDLNPHTT